jgi:son of sevenless-like protein
MEVFLLTYRAFLTPKELLELIELRWNTRPPPGFDLEEFKDTRLLPIRLRIYNVLKTWLEKFSHDFDTDLVNALEALSKKMEAHGSATSGQTLQRMIAKFREGASYLSKQLMLSEPPEPILPEQVASILDLHPLEVARQLTVEEYRLFKKIQPFELLSTQYLCFWAERTKLINLARFELDQKGQRTDRA